MTRCWVTALLMLSLAGAATGAEHYGAELGADEPSVRELQRAAARLAAVEPERVRSWQRRIRVAALAPELRLSLGRGARLLATTSTVDGLDRIGVDNNSSWSFDARATWSLDRLVFDKEELRVSREAQRLAARRETLLGDVAKIYFQRRRLQAKLALRPPTDQLELVDEQLRIEELGAILDGLTGGALSERQRGNSP